MPTLDLQRDGQVLVTQQQDLDQDPGVVAVTVAVQAAVHGGELASGAGLFQRRRPG
ncbi:hypothetical protein [Actinomadura rudentiformis]|uniref:hypothetical protein n=1 Tax=Actinomadura rudentiformis TaxID=359158 RepID=UPI00178C45F4|nr:hypothetical protein [Actinomadura rudentiformis]